MIKLNKNLNAIFMIHKESASKDMGQSGSFSDDLKTAPHLVTNGGLLFIYLFSFFFVIFFTYAICPL